MRDKKIKIRKSENLLARLWKNENCVPVFQSQIELACKHVELVFTYILYKYCILEFKYNLCMVNSFKIST